MNGVVFNLIIGITGIIATSIELLFLYRDSLNTAARMAKVLDIPDEELSKVEMEQSMPRWLIYAAMGAPGHRGILFGINPLEKIGKFGLMFRKILQCPVLLIASLINCHFTKLIDYFKKSRFLFFGKFLVF